MSIEIAAFAFGGVLIMIGALGGGFEVRELKVPKVGKLSRVLCLALGFVFAGMGFQHVEVSPAAAETEVQPALAQGSTEFRIFDQLGDDQLHEQVNILIDGRIVGTLNVSRQFPEAMISVTVPQPGVHSFTLEASGTFESSDDPVELAGVGQGMIDVAPGDSFRLAGSVSGQTWLVSMVENDAAPSAQN